MIGRTVKGHEFAIDVLSLERYMALAKRVAKLKELRLQGSSRAFQLEAGKVPRVELLWVGGVCDCQLAGVRFGKV